MTKPKLMLIVFSLFILKFCYLKKILTHKKIKFFINTIFKIFKIFKIKMKLIKIQIFNILNILIIIKNILLYQYVIKINKIR